MKTMETLKAMPFGRVFAIVGKQKTTICGQFYKSKHRALFGTMKLELTHWSDINTIQHDMECLVNGHYRNVLLWQTHNIVEAVPSAEYRH